MLRTGPQSEKSTVRSQKFALRRSRKLTPANILKELLLLNRWPDFEIFSQKGCQVSVSVKGQGHFLTLVRGHSDFKVKT